MPLTLCWISELILNASTSRARLTDRNLWSPFHRLLGQLPALCTLSYNSDWYARYWESNESKLFQFLWNPTESERGIAVPCNLERLVLRARLNSIALHSIITKNASTLEHVVTREPQPATRHHLPSIPPSPPCALPKMRYWQADVTVSADFSAAEPNKAIILIGVGNNGHLERALHNFSTASELCIVAGSTTFASLGTAIATNPGIDDMYTHLRVLCLGGKWELGDEWVSVASNLSRSIGLS